MTEPTQGGAPAPAAAAPAPAAEPAKPPPAKPGETPPAGGAAPEAARPEQPPARSWTMLEQQEQRQRRDREKDAAAREAWNKEKTTALENASAATIERIKQRAAAGEYEEIAKELGLDYKAWTTKRLASFGGKAPAGSKPAPAAPADLDKAIADGVARELARREEESKKTRETEEATTWAGQWDGFKKSVKAETHELLADELAADPKHVEDVLREMSRRQPLSYQEAADLYEKYLVDRTVKRAQSPKVKALLAAPPVEPAKHQEQTGPRATQGQEQQTEGGPRTLTNVLAASSSAPATKPGSPNSKTARIAAQRAEEKAAMKRAAGRLP